MEKTYSVETTPGGIPGKNSGNPSSLEAGPKDSGGGGANHCLKKIHLIKRALTQTTTIITISNKIQLYPTISR